MDMPMRAVYAGEPSSLSAFKSLFEFGAKHVAIFLKRIVYQYFIRDFNFGSLCLLFGVPLVLFGCIFGMSHFVKSNLSGILATPGTAMLFALMIIVGLQFLFTFVAQDQNAVPRIPLQRVRPDAGPFRPSTDDDRSN